MADKKISELTAGAPAVATDAVPVARSGVTRKLTLADIWTIPSGSQLLAADGTVAAPAISFGSNSAIGIRKTGNALQFCRGSAVHFSLDQTYGDDLTLQSGGSVSFTASADASLAPDTGIARAAAGVLKVVAGNPTNTAGTLRVGPGLVSAPSVAFSDSTNTGMYRASGNFPSFSGNGTWQGTFENGLKLSSAGQLQFLSGTAPTNSPDTGIARVAAAVVKVTDASTGWGRIRVHDGAANSVGYGFQTDGDDTGMWSNGAGNLNFSTNNTCNLQINSAAARFASSLQVNWSSGDPSSAAADVGFVRKSAGVIGVSNGSSGSGALDVGNAGFFTITATAGNNTTVTQPSGADNSGIVFSPGNNSTTISMFRRGNSPSLEFNGPGASTPSFILGYHANVTVNTGTANPATKADSQKFYTNTGDGDGSIVNLPNDPALGTTYYFAVVAAQALDIIPASGESIQDAGANGTTKITSNTVGSTLKLVAVTGGSGAVWMVLSKTGTWNLT